MCGVAGLLFKGGATGPVGQQVLRMLDVLGSRGVDGTGVALYGSAREGRSVLRVELGGRGTPNEQAARVAERVAALTTVREATVQHDYLWLVVDETADLGALADTVERGDAGVAVFSAGRALEIVKQVGPAAVLRDRYCLSTFEGTHGIGHTRLATESRVDIAHCHPFWARPHADIAVVHNGQITNYRKLRRMMEMRGTRFCTGNDSEIIGLYLAQQMAAGATLQEAMERSVDELDGTFTYLVSTPEGIGMAKDFFATKPLVITETDEYVAIASEEIALCTALGGTPRTSQPSAGEVRVWQR